jgi:hypothetical protein
MGMSAHILQQDGLDPHTQAFYRQALMALRESGMPFLVGGAYALGYYTGIMRHTKDFDIFVRPADFKRVLDVFSAAGYTTEITFPYWLGKVLWETDNIDVIFSSGNGIARVDDAWFAHAGTGEILGLPLRICPAEEIIWSKATIMGRERYDGADIAHILHACGPRLDWQRLLDRFGPHWRVLFSHIILFGYIYPAERGQIPDWVIQTLLNALQNEMCNSPSTERVCQGTLLSWDQYLIDVEQRSYQDSRLLPQGAMTAEDIAHITAVLNGTKRVEARPPSGPRAPVATARMPKRRAVGRRRTHRTDQI